MSDEPADVPDLNLKSLACFSAVAIAFLWLAQPPFKVWPFAFVALLPWLVLVESPKPFPRRGYLVLWGISAIYWLLTLQGLRHAHPVMYLSWMALSGYLAVYHVLFLAVARSLRSHGWSLVFAAPLVWVAQECLRNYLLTGISVTMLGHSMADIPLMIQIADSLGTYGVGFVLVCANVGVYCLVQFFRRRITLREAMVGGTVGVCAIGITLGYGWFRLGQPLGEGATTFALLQRDEEVEYEQSREREVEIFQNYGRQAITAVTDRNVHAVVWPESMFSAANPWLIQTPNATAPAEANLTDQEFRQNIDDGRAYFSERVGYVQAVLAASSKNRSRPPHLLVGCGVVEYDQRPSAYSGVIHLTPDGFVSDWYGKTHLVMIGEYIPILPHIPILRSFVPPNLMLCSGPGPKSFQVGDVSVAPNVCIETAVERVTINHLADLRNQSSMPDVVVTVTNDGWFDDSSVIEHHLRCAQLVAVASRRPVLSAANNGPTAWISSSGEVVDRLATGENGAVIATPKIDKRISGCLLIGDWPARGCLILAAVLLFKSWRRSRSMVSSDPDQSNCLPSA